MELALTLEYPELEEGKLSLGEGVDFPALLELLLWLLKAKRLFGSCLIPARLQPPSLRVEFGLPGPPRLLRKLHDRAEVWLSSKLR